jgi:FkbM family methyltransferase
MDPRLAKFIKQKQKRIWTLVGGRRLSAFGHRLQVDPETELPESRRYRIPLHQSREQLFRYTDHVQLRSTSAYLDAFAGSPIVVEVGAHTGAYACILGSIIKQKNGRMLAVEPNPDHFDRLTKNIALNGLERIVTPVESAIGDTNGTVKLTTKGARSVISSDSNTGITVHASTLTTLLARHKIPRIDLLIIDVEGAELPVLRGFPWGKIPVSQIFCELHPYAWPDFGYEAADLDKFFDDHKLLPIDMFFKAWPRLPDSTHWSSYIGPTLLVPIGSA